MDGEFKSSLDVRVRNNKGISLVIVFFFPQGNQKLYQELSEGGRLLKLSWLRISMTTELMTEYIRVCFLIQFPKYSDNMLAYYSIVCITVSVNMVDA